MIMREITGLIATDPQGVIGRAGHLPWHYPDELEHFRELTHGQVIVMGRKTFETLPHHLLKERHSIVFSRLQIGQNTGHTFVSSVEEFLRSLHHWKNKKIFMIGGAEIAHLFLENNLLTDFILTKIHKPYEGDTVLNLKYLAEWTQIRLNQTENFTIYQLKNPKGEENDLSCGNSLME